MDDNGSGGGGGVNFKECYIFASNKDAVSVGRLIDLGEFGGVK